MSAAEVSVMDHFNVQVREFLRIHEGNPCEPYVRNLRTEVTNLSIGGNLFPLTVNDTSHPGNAWICSACTAYGDYALEEVSRFGHPLLGLPLRAVARGLMGWLRAGQLDRGVIVNNWLLSTNIYPAAEPAVAGKIRDACLERWPTHAIWLRSLNARQNSEWIDEVRAAGFELIPSRQVYLNIDLAASARAEVNLRRDLKLLKTTSLRHIRGEQFTAEDFETAAHLYSQLYTQKYSKLNPQYSTQFLRSWHRAGLLELHGLRGDDNVLQAAVGIFGIGSVLTAPIVGYNMQLPQKAGLYRLLMACVAETAMLRGASINFSAGAADFKRLRGGQSELEYSAVYSAHLSKQRRRPIRALRLAAEKIGVPVMKKYQL